MRCLLAGVYGGVILSFGMAWKIVEALVAGRMGKVDWREAWIYEAALFALGFVCGVIIWAGRGLYRRFGMAGDALVGVAVTLALIVSGMFVFAPDMLRAPNLAVAAVPLFASAVIIGVLGGAGLGHEFRKDLAKHFKPPGSRIVITDALVERVIHSAPLAQARTRAERGAARPRHNAAWEKHSSWSLVCQEMLDARDDDEWDDIMAELVRRGFSFEQVDAMRRFAWRTAGWLILEKGVLVGPRVDENDIRMALRRQRFHGIISRKQYKQARLALKGPSRIEEASLAHPTAASADDGDSANDEHWDRT